MLLDNLLEERLGNIKLPVNNTSPLALEMVRKIIVRHYALSKFPILEYSYTNELKLLDYYDKN